LCEVATKLRAILFIKMQTDVNSAHLIAWRVNLKNALSIPEPASNSMEDYQK